MGITDHNFENTCKYSGTLFNRDTKGTCQSVCISRMTILSGLSDMESRTRFLDKQTKADISMATKCLNCTLALASLNYGNLMVICHTLGGICKSNQAKIFTATSLNYRNCRHPYSISTLFTLLLSLIF